MDNLSHCVISSSFSLSPFLLIHKVLHLAAFILNVLTSCHPLFRKLQLDLTRLQGRYWWDIPLNNKTQSMEPGLLTWVQQAKLCVVSKLGHLRQTPKRARVPDSGTPLLNAAACVSCTPLWIHITVASPLMCRLVESKST